MQLMTRVFAVIAGFPAFLPGQRCQPQCDSIVAAHELVLFRIYSLRGRFAQSGFALRAFGSE